MFLTELAERRVAVIFCGRFQPFHRGHAIVYNKLVAQYGRNNVYIGTSGIVAPPDSPFTLSQRIYFMNLMGIANDRVLQLSNNYNPTVAANALGITDLSNTVMIFPVSQKDVDEKPGLFSGGVKKDGTPKMLQPLPQDLSQVESANQHAYIQIVDVEPFEVLGQTITGATSIRDLYTKADQAQRQQIIKDLYGKYTNEAEQIMNSALDARAVTAPEPKVTKQAKLQKVAKPEPVDEVSHFVPSQPRRTDDGYYKLLMYRYRQNPGLLSAKEKQELHDYIQSRQQVKEAAGVGVVAKNKRMARDPRYSMSMTVDVHPDTPKKNLQAFDLIENETDRAWHRLQQLGAVVDEIKTRLATEKLPANYREELKKRLAKLDKDRVDVMLGRQ